MFKKNKIEIIIKKILIIETVDTTLGEILQ